MKIAFENREAASELIRRGYFRSGISRAYYAVYSKIAHELTARGFQMPVDREGPSHTTMRVMVRHNLFPLKDKPKAVALSRIVMRLYNLRAESDYHPSIIVSARDAREALGLMYKVFYEF